MKVFRPSWIRGLSFVLAAAFGQAAFGAVDFEKEVRPLLVDRCASCHGEKKQKALLRLDRRADAMKGGENGAVIVAGNPEASPLFQRVVSTDADEVMPSKGERLTEREVAVLRQWIAEGAVWPDDGSLADPFALAKGHWAFTPPRKATVPAGEHPVDFFITAKHRELGLTPAPEADRRTLLRRVTLDLTGLPPGVEDAAAFLSSTNSTYETLVDRLLVSPRYGERWGRFWLDLARWAESDGYEANDLRASAWRYRDYVVKAFNDDLPYDAFLREQIAGDELSPYSDEHLIATGFLAAARNSNNEEDKAVPLNEPLVDIANTTASVVLGLTMSCLQCHDHKFEALTIRDYYAWHGLFVRGQVNGLLLRDDPGIAAWETSQPPELDTARQLLQQLADPVRARLGAEAKAKLTAELGGPSVEGVKVPTTRRSLYLTQRRYLLPTMQALFDAPTANESCPRWHTSTAPLQPLALLNNPENVALARSFAEKVAAQAGENSEQRITVAFHRALFRAPRPDEREATRTFFAQPGLAPEQALAQFCQVLLNSNEFLYIE